ncbi:MAG: enoyl-CoA hydratase/isomerase family protein [Ignavibacteriales bacterium]
MAEYENILLRQEGKVAILTINRPKYFNTMNEEVWKELMAAADEIEDMEDVRAVVINSTGDHFSAGIDLKLLATVSRPFVMRWLQWLQSVYTRWEEFQIPVICAMQGIAYGSAIELALACDIRIAAENARIAIPEVRFGLSPDMGGTYRLAKLVGPGQAKRLLMTCDEIDAQEALRIGLVEYVVPTEELTEKALKLAKKIANMPPIAERMCKKGVNVAVECGRTAGLLFEQAQSTLCCGTDDMKEAINAFFEKRKPEFKGE